MKIKVRETFTVSKEDGCEIVLGETPIIAITDEPRIVKICSDNIECVSYSDNKLWFNTTAIAKFIDPTDLFMTAFAMLDESEFGSSAMMGALLCSYIPEDLIKRLKGFSCLVNILEENPNIKTTGDVITIFEETMRKTK
jgi:hypothetical protein